MTADRNNATELEGVVAQSARVEYQPRTAPFDALVLMVEGESEISIAGTPHRLTSGRLLRLPAGQPHAVKAVTPFKMILIMIRA